MVERFSKGRGEGPAHSRRIDDELAIEEPLEIRIGATPLAVVMRTPGADLDLVRGLLFTEGILRSRADLRSLGHCRSLPPKAPDSARENLVLAELAAGCSFRPARFRRNLLTTSACGVCSRATLDQLSARAPSVAGGPLVAATELATLPDRLRAEQHTFATTGGLHAAALFRVRAGRLERLVVREDVGRHNAVDKVIGAALLHDLLPLSSCVLQVSGRVSYEIVQKARVAGIPIVSAVSAPSTLAVELARDGNQTLLGFVRAGRFNVYCGRERVSAVAIPRVPGAIAEAASAPPAPPASRAARHRSGTRGRRRAG